MLSSLLVLLLLVVARHTMITTSVRGHLASQDFPPPYGWNKCDPVALFDAPIQTYYRDDLLPLQQMLTNLASSTNNPPIDAVILWLDCDREGEMIGAEVRDAVLLGRTNHNLPIYRARFSTVLDGEIDRALRSLGRLNTNWVEAVAARMELDLRVGAAFTRFQTVRLQKKFDGFSNGVISYGPCQFPTLGFVVERWACIETFVPQDFWYLELTLRVDSPPEALANGPESTTNINNNNHTNASRPIQFQWKRGRLYDPTLTQYLYESCLDAGEAVVTQLQGRPKNKWRPVPLATVEMQKRASRYLRIGSEQVMTAAEELYQQGYISYPRTETEKFRPEFQHQPLLEQLATTLLPLGHALGLYADKLLHQPGQFQIPRAGQHDDQAHPPITPCRAVDPATIANATQRSVYTLVVKHYLACCSRDSVGKETVLTLQLGDEEFTAKGLMILEANWLEIYHPWERWSTGQGELPPLQVGSRVRPASLLLKEGCTTPPLPISEVELITAMDRNGIGTDATIAQHIATIQDRDYAKQDAATMRFSPTELGIALVEAYNSMGYQLNKPDLRRETEAACNDVAAGRTSKDVIMQHLLQKMRDCFLACTREAHKLDAAVARHFAPRGSTSVLLQAQFSVCGGCGQTSLALRQDSNNNDNHNRRKLLYCDTCRMGWNLPRGEVQPKLQPNNDPNSNATAPFLCPICQYQVLEIQRGDGYEGNGYQVCPQCFSDPPADHGGGSEQFRCFNCLHSTCTLATGTNSANAVEVMDCPWCGGRVCLQKNSRGLVLGCNQYSRTKQERCGYTVWLPKECSTVTADDEEHPTLCPVHNSRRLTFQFRPGSVPPHLGRQVMGVCVWCDADLRHDLHIALPQRHHIQTAPPRARQQPQQQRHPQQQQPRQRGGRGRGVRGSAAARGRGRVAPNSRTAGGGGGGNVCYRCNQPGHYANACPTSGASGSNNNKRSSSGVCYRCNQPGHFANACPNNGGV